MGSQRIRHDWVCRHQGKITIRLRGETQVFGIVDRCFTVWATRETHFHFHLCTKINLWPFKNSWWYYWIFSICPYKCSVTSSPCSAPRGDWLELSILTSSHMFWFQLRVSPWEAHADQMEVRREVRACVPQPDHCISLHKTIDIISLSTVLPLYGTF